MKSSPGSRSIALGGALLLTSLVASAQTTFLWTGGLDGTSNNLFGVSGYGNWDPEMAAADIASGTANIFRIAERVDGGPTDPIGGGNILFINEIARIGHLIFDDSAGHFPANLILAAVPTAASTTDRREFFFDTTNSTIITLTENVTGTVTIGYDRATHAQVAFRLPSSGVSTIHVAHPDAVLDLRGLFNSSSVTVSGTSIGRGGIHAGTADISNDRASLRKTGDGTLDLRTEDANGNRVKSLIIEGGTVIVAKNADMAWAQDVFQADHVVINGGTLHMQGFTANSGATRGFQVGENGGTFHMTDAAHAILGIVSDVPGQSGVLIKSGPTALRLAADNTYSGGTHIMEGRLRYTSDAALGTGKVTIHEGGQLAPTVSSAWVLANDIDIVGDSVQFGGDGQSLNLAGTIDLTGATRTFVLANSVHALGDVVNGSLILAATNNVEALHLNGTNTLTGTTTATRGGLVVNSVLAGDVTAGRSMVEAVEWIGFVGGAGTIGGNVLVHGELRPGATHSGTTGTLAIGGNLDFAQQAMAVFELAATALFDRVAVAGDASLDGLLSVQLLNDYVPSYGDSFQLFAVDGSLNVGSNFAFDLPALGGSLFWNTDDFATVGSISVVPEPATFAWLGGLVVLLVVGLRRRRC